MSGFCRFCFHCCKGHPQNYFRHVHQTNERDEVRKAYWERNKIAAKLVELGKENKGLKKLQTCSDNTNSDRTINTRLIIRQIEETC